MEITSTSKALPQIKPAALRGFHGRLMAWYAKAGRHDLPWRKTADPYPIWLSEVMLQQTQVSTVLSRFYYPFLKTFPTIESLATAPRESVMKAWEGLGYYRRAGYLHEAAKQAGKKLPTDIGALMALPGIGKNTAHAIAAFAYRQPVPIMEANVKRIVARIFALAKPSEHQLWEGAEVLLNTREAFDHNQAMMDLGNAICLPKKPRCSLCPANTICQGQTNPETYPAPKPKKQTPTRKLNILVQEDAAGKLYLEARDAALLGGLHGFPQNEPILKTDRLLGKIVHIYSHFRLEGSVYYRATGTVRQSPQWHSRKEIVDLPLSGVDHKILALIDNCHTPQKKRPKARKSSAKR